MNYAKPGKGGVGQQQGGRGLQRKIVRQFRAWVHHPQTLDMLYGPRLSHFEMQNKMRACLGLAPLTMQDIPPGEDWEIVPPRTLLTRKEREERIRQILRLPPETSTTAGPLTGKEEGASSGPLPAQTG
jgi:hypothetical protein